MALLLRHACKASRNLPILPVSAPPAEASSGNTQMQCEGLSSASKWLLLRQKEASARHNGCPLNPNTARPREPEFHICLPIALFLQHNRMPPQNEVPWTLQLFLLTRLLQPLHYLREEQVAPVCPEIWWAGMYAECTTGAPKCRWSLITSPLWKTLKKVTAWFLCQGSFIVVKESHRLSFWHDFTRYRHSSQ